MHRRFIVRGMFVDVLRSFVDVCRHSARPWKYQVSKLSNFLFSEFLIRRLVGSRWNHVVDLRVEPDLLEAGKDVCFSVSVL